ncbi:MAG: hypothetical protein AAB473_02260 [Patescibacteria group bacterium]
MLQNDYFPPKSKIYDSLRLKILQNRKAYSLVLSARKFLQIPKNGFVSEETLRKFKDDAHGRTEVRMMELDTPEIDTSEKCEQSMREHLHELPEIYLSHRAIEITKILSFPENYRELVAFFILCEEMKEISSSSNYSVLLNLPSVKKHYVKEPKNYSVRPRFPLRNGLAINVHGPLTKKDIKSLKNEIDAFFKKYPNSVRRQVGKKRNLKEDLTVLKGSYEGKKGLDICDEISPNLEGNPNEMKEIRRILRKKQRLEDIR